MYVDDPIRTVSPMTNLEKLQNETKKDKKFVKDYYHSQNTNWIKHPILNYIKKLFFYEDRNYSIIEILFTNIFISIAYLLINSSFLKIGFDYFIFHWVLLFSFIIFLVYINILKFKGVILIFIIYITSIILTNNVVYNASCEGIYKNEYENIIVDNNLSEFDFFIQNINKLNLFKSKEQ